MEEQTGRPHTGPRYVPRALLIDPSEFGRNPTPDFVQWTAENASHRAGAQAQHVLSFRIRQALRERDMTVAQLASATDLNYQRLTRVLRGTIVMRMEDLGVIARVVPEAFDYVLGTAANPVFTGAAARRLAALNATRDEMRAELEELGNQIEVEEARENAASWDGDRAPVNAQRHPGGHRPRP